MKKLAKPEYIATNESLDSIMAGMQLRRKDSVLAILGSGDQAFAMLECGCSVTSIDCDAKQRSLVRERAGMLENDNIYGFLYYAGCSEELIDDTDRMHRDARNEYFMQEGRLKKIRKSLSKLEIRKGNIFNAKGIFTRVYLSNALDYGNVRSESYPHRRELLRKASRKLVPGGILYSASGWCMEEILAYSRKETITLELDRELTAMSRDFDTGEWTPSVYRKIRKSRCRQSSLRCARSGPVTCFEL